MSIEQKGARVIAHAHSTWSYDGKLTLDEWRDLARSRGVDVVLFAEHEETGWTSQRYDEYVAQCARASAHDVRLVPGIEFNQDGFHVLSFGLRTWPSRPSSARELATAVHRQGCILCLAHPTRYGWSYPESLLGAADAVEVWNSNWVCEGMLGPHPRSLELARGKAMLVGQDVHKPKHLSSLFVRTDSQDVLADIYAGRYHFERGTRSWAPGELHGLRLAGGLQAYRTWLVRSALRAYRSTRRAARRVLRRQNAPPNTGPKQ
jgi:hypothetical protein